MTSLQCVSLTGADDETSIADLDGLGKRYPFVEWALLYVPGKEGDSRNPTQAWRERFFAAAPAGRNAVHLCGSTAFEQLLNNELPNDVVKAQRLQLNVNARKADFSDEDVFRIFRRAMVLGPGIILQRHEQTAAVVDRFLTTLDEDDRLRVTVLLDESRGRGALPDAWTVPPMCRAVVGFAGGIGPDVVEAVLPQLESFARPYWIDMESGIRTDNRFDIAKAEAVLSRSKPFVDGP